MELKAAGFRGCYLAEYLAVSLILNRFDIIRNPVHFEFGAGV